MGKQIRKMAASLLVALFAVSLLSTNAEAAAKNAAPVITEGTSVNKTVDKNASGVAITLNATDANGDSLTWSVTKQASQGTIALPASSIGKSFTINYKPTQDYIGSDSFIVQVKDSKGATDSITINITIKYAIKYIALGDSIATGTIYPGKKITSYVTYFYQYLQQQNPYANVTMQSFATDGDKTNELLAKLQAGGMNTAITGANVITISIGGNNLMQASKDSSALGGYNFNKFNITIAEEGTTFFEAQWDDIIDYIKGINSSAKIIVNTIYNPCNDNDALHGVVNPFLARINDAVNSYDVVTETGAIRYKVADVYNPFDMYGVANNMRAITYFYPSPSDLWGNLTRNPHPNATGQNIITTAVRTAYTTY